MNTFDLYYFRMQFFKCHFLFFLLLLSLTSCMFSKRVGFIVERRTVPQQQIYYVSEDSIKIIVDQVSFLKFAEQQASYDTVKNRLALRLSSEMVAIDSLEKEMVTSNGYYSDLYFATQDFLLKELDKGNVYVFDLNTQKRIRCIKRVAQYYREYAFERKKTYIAYKKRNKTVYFQRLILIHF
jgi:hypothetical protein